MCILPGDYNLLNAIVCRFSESSILLRIDASVAAKWKCKRVGAICRLTSALNVACDMGLARQSHTLSLRTKMVSWIHKYSTVTNLSIHPCAELLTSLTAKRSWVRLHKYMHTWYLVYHTGMHLMQAFDNYGHSSSRYGRGTYFSKRSQLSCKFAYRLDASEAAKHGGGDVHQIVRCRVLTGVPFVADKPHAYTIPPAVLDRDIPKHLW